MVTSSPSSSKTLDVWYDASSESIEVHAPLWPELAALHEAARQLYRESDGVEVFDTLARRAFDAYRILASTPVSPLHEAIGSVALIRDCDDTAQRWPSHAHSPIAVSLGMATRTLVTTESVFVSPLEAVASRFGSGVVVAPRASLVASIRTVLVDELELNGLVVLTRSELKLLVNERFDVAIVIGEPGATYATFRLRAQAEARRAGWLLTAPPAAHVALLVAGDCQAIVPEAYWLLASGNHPTLELIDEEARPADLPSVTQQLLEEPSWPIVPPPPARIGESIVMARQVSFASKRIAYFSDKGWPRPRVLQAGETSIGTAYRQLDDLGLGAIFIMRAGRSDLDEIRRRAEARLRNDGWGTDEIQRASEAADLLKERLRQCLASEGVASLKRRLQASGLSEGYALVLTRNPLNEAYIAPIDKGYDIFVEVLGLPELHDVKSLLFKLRSAHQQSGNEIRSEMEQGLRTDPSWMDQVDNAGFAVVDAGALGSLFLEVLTRVHEQSVPVSAACLGHLLDVSGRLFESAGVQP